MLIFVLMSLTTTKKRKISTSIIHNYHIFISDEPESNRVEISPNITAELNDNGELIGIEILDATNYLRDFVLESVQAKLLNLANKVAQ